MQAACRWGQGVRSGVQSAYTGGVQVSRRVVGICNVGRPFLSWLALFRLFRACPTSKTAAMMSSSSADLTYAGAFPALGLHAFRLRSDGGAFSSAPAFPSSYHLLLVTSCYLVLLLLAATAPAPPPPPPTTTTTTTIIIIITATTTTTAVHSRCGGNQHTKPYPRQHPKLPPSERLVAEG